VHVHGGGGVKFQQWDGKPWTLISDWIASDQALAPGGGVSGQVRPGQGHHTARLPVGARRSLDWRDLMG
jgi:hypothetical protein